MENIEGVGAAVEDVAQKLNHFSAGRCRRQSPERSYGLDCQNNADFVLYEGLELKGGSNLMSPLCEAFKIPHNYMRSPACCRPLR